MRRLFPGVIWLMFASYGFGQLDSYTVTVGASRSLTVPSDQVAFNVIVDSPMTAGLSDVVAAVGSVGITASNLSDIYTSTITVGTKTQPVLVWSFTLAAPFAALRDTIMALGNLQQAIAKQNSGMTLSFSVVGTQVSMALQEAQTCAFSDLMADARAQAQKLGDAAGFGVGKVLALSDASVQAPAAIYAARLGAFSLINTSGAIVGAFQFVVPSNCSIMVKFQLLGS